MSIGKIIINQVLLLSILLAHTNSGNNICLPLLIGRDSVRVYLVINSFKSTTRAVPLIRDKENFQVLEMRKKITLPLSRPHILPLEELLEKESLHYME